MYCKRCGKELKDDAKFCRFCGQEISTPKQETQQPAVQTQVEIKHSTEEPAENSGVVNKVVVGTVVAIVIIVIGVVLYLLMPKQRDDIETTGEASVGYEESTGDSGSQYITDQDSQEAVSLGTPGASDIPETPEPQTSTPTAVPESVPESPEEPVSQYILPTSNSQYLTMEDLAGLTKEQCRLARNELYARHGRRFDDTELQGYFDSCDWYAGTILPADFDDSVLNEYEIANRDLIVQYETEMGYR